MHANQGSPSTQLMSILHNTTGKMCLLPGNTSRSIQHRSNIKSVDLGPMPMPISRKFTSSDKMPILHIKCQYFTNLPIHNQSCPNTGQYIWTIVLLSFGTSLYGGWLLVSAEDDFTLQSWTISASLLPIHSPTTILPIHQCNVNPEHILPSSSNSPSTTKQTNQN